MRRVMGSWFTSSPRRCGRDRQSTRVSGQESGSLIAVPRRRISLYRFFRPPPPLTVFFLSRTAARASSARVWESLAHVSTSVCPNETNDRAAAVATDSLHRTASRSFRDHPSADCSPIRAVSAHGKRPAHPSVLPSTASRPDPRTTDWHRSPHPTPPTR